MSVEKDKRHRHGKNADILRIPLSDCLQIEHAGKHEFARIVALRDIHDIMAEMNAPNPEQHVDSDSLLSGPVWQYVAAMVELPPSSKVNAKVVGEANLPDSSYEGLPSVNNADKVTQSSLLKEVRDRLAILQANDLTLSVTIPQVKMTQQENGNAEFQQARRSGDFTFSFSYGRRYLFDFDAITDPSAPQIDIETAVLIKKVIEELNLDLALIPGF
jgi:hypothetical protein